MAKFLNAATVINPLSVEGHQFEAKLLMVETDRDLKHAEKDEAGIIIQETVGRYDRYLVFRKADSTLVKISINRKLRDQFLAFKDYNNFIATVPYDERVCQVTCTKSAGDLTRKELPELKIDFEAGMYNKYCEK